MCACVYMKWQLHKNASCFEQILDATSHKTAAVCPLTFHLTNHSSKKNKIYWPLMKKEGRIHQWHSLMDTYILMHQCWPSSKELHQLVRTLDAAKRNWQEGLIDYKDRWLLAITPTRRYVSSENTNVRKYIKYSNLCIYIYIYIYLILRMLVSRLLYGCPAWTLTKLIEIKLYGNCTRMLRAILNKSWKQYLAKQQLFRHLPIIWKPSKLDEQDMLDTAGGARMNS